MPRTHSARRWPARRLSLWQIWNLIGLAFFLYLLISRRKKVGYLLGFIPYDFRAPTPRVLLERMWNPADRRLFTPRPFGIGWTVNLYTVARKLRLAPAH